VNKTILCIFIFLGICGTAYGTTQEFIGEIDDVSPGILNEEIRKVNSELFFELDGAGSVKMKDAKEIDLQDEGLDNVGEVKGMIIENRTDDPASPATGQIWYRTNL